MNLKLQFGFGMMDHSRNLIDSWGGGNVILSPRDLTCEQLERFSSDIRGLRGGSVWLDPQFYVPRADHERLCSHDYWPSDFETGIFWQGANLQRLIQKLDELNTKLKSAAFVLPGMLAKPIDEDWFVAQEAVIEEARTIKSGRPLICTIALSDDAVKDVSQVGELLERAETWKVDGFYVVAQHPSDAYLVSDPIWLANLIDLCAGLRLLRKSVTLGYCNHQMLIASVAKVSAISSGTWMNVRTFPPDKFIVPVDDEIRQRTKWYYCPQALSEYKIPFLDVAQRQGILESMKPDPALGSQYADILFTGVQPTTVKAFSEQSAFRHYLHCLHSQSRGSSKSTFQETVDSQRFSLDAAEKLLATLRSKGVFGGMRDYSDALDASRSAIQVIISLRGPVLSRAWSTL
ncbi:MAG: hypothetical protein PW792_01510 [Acidobacteriaceae bacterium]|nr:hypothetical protein [Acidobacteriaceae bacterium]